MNLPDPDEARLRDLVRRLGPDSADPALRDRLRRSFVAGGAVSTRSPRRWRPVAMATAALVLLAATVWFLRGGPTIRVIDHRGAGQVVVDGETVKITELEGVLREGVTIRIPEGARLTLLLSELAYWELVGGSHVKLIASAGPVLEGELSAGEVRVQTTASFEGHRVLLRTPHGRVVVHGSLLSVQCDASGTCVCVLDGQVEVGVDEADLELVPPGKRKVMSVTGQTEILPVAPPHEAGVRDLQRRVGK